MLNTYSVSLQKANEKLSANANSQVDDKKINVTNLNININFHQQNKYPVMGVKVNFIFNSLASLRQCTGEGFSQSLQVYSLQFVTSTCALHKFYFIDVGLRQERDTEPQSQW